jgi:hypothetical protein
VAILWQTCAQNPNQPVCLSDDDDDDDDDEESAS